MCMLCDADYPVKKVVRSTVFKVGYANGKRILQPVFVDMHERNAASFFQSLNRVARKDKADKPDIVRLGRYYTLRSMTNLEKIPNRCLHKTKRSALRYFSTVKTVNEAYGTSTGRITNSAENPFKFFSFPYEKKGDVKIVLLKERSPSEDHSLVFDQTFSKFTE